MPTLRLAGPRCPSVPIRCRRVVLAVVGVAVLSSCGGEPSAPVAAPEPASLASVGAASQSAPAGAVLPGQVTFEVRDAQGRPVPEATVRFTIVQGGGALSTSGARTGSDGRASTVWVLGIEPGPQSLQAAVGGLEAQIQATAIEPERGETHLGRSQYVEYLPGDLPLVLAAPHGGALAPSEIADRTTGVTGQDLNTQDVARRLADAVEGLVGGRPHLVVGRLPRRKLDPNREIVEAAQGDVHAERAWWEYHAFIDAAKAAVARAHGEGLFVDVHGHGHPIQRLELGYLISAADLARPDDQLDGLAAGSSVRALTGVTALSLLLRGSTSLGALMEERGMAAVPSPNQPHAAAEPYFTGGYSTARHGSRDGGSISAIQVEMNFTGVRDTPEARERVASALAEVLQQFFVAHLEGLAGAAHTSHDRAPFPAAAARA